MPLHRTDDILLWQGKLYFKPSCSVKSLRRTEGSYIFKGKLLQKCYYVKLNRNQTRSIITPLVVSFQWQDDFPNITNHLSHHFDSKLQKDSPAKSAETDILTEIDSTDQINCLFPATLQESELQGLDSTCAYC
mmetsp:Transcript_33044/g.42218  ORF Transcript_33044/g.42218 Transcript_33044/m.42218 type:complete len:133 (+) Transcript_33044:157-555(+)